MSDHDALLAAVCAEPDEDTLRLAFADWLDEHEQPERAAFIRAQIELARTPVWEPFAVLCRWRRTDWLTGKPFRSTLTPVDGFYLEWQPDAFRRGLGWRLNVRSFAAWEQQLPALLDRESVGELHLWGATLDDWRRFAASAIVSRLRRIHLVTSPIEPLLVLRDNPAALGITDIFFERASGAGMPVVIEELLQSPLGRTVRGLHFHVGYESLNDLIDALNSSGESHLARLSFSVMGLTTAHALRLFTGPVAKWLTELDLRENPLGSEGFGALVLCQQMSRLCNLGIAGTGAAGRGLEALVTSTAVQALRRLDLSSNPLTPRLARVMSRSQMLAGLRSLNLSTCRIGERELYHLTRAKFWSNLVELDLRNNPIPPAGVAHLLDAAMPADLTALVLDGDQLGEEARKQLRRKYGEAVVFWAGGQGVKPAETT
jgi:uncharacterized protein (TIGR02996 family)